MKPFVILALPRTGTRMLITALESHPDIPKITHEFKGDYEKFLEHPYVLSNTIQPWMKPPIKIMHVGREDAEAGALSLIKMSYTFPDLGFDIPNIDKELPKLAKFRRVEERKMKKCAEFSTTYEQLIGFETPISREICRFLGVEERKLVTQTGKREKMRARNQPKSDSSQPLTRMKREENVIDEFLTETKSGRFTIPEGFPGVQFVFDRTKFELPSPQSGDGAEVFRCETHFGDGRWTGCGFGDVRREGKLTKRPGQRMLWSVYPPQLPKNAENVWFRIVPARPFYCHMNLDFY